MATAAKPAPPAPDVVEQLTKIPGFLRAKSWNNGARLMEKWFQAPANSSLDAGVPDTTTIRMDSWVLTFPRAKAVYDRLVREKIWANAKAQKVRLAPMVQREAPAGPRVCARLGNLNRLLDHPWHERFYTNQRGVSTEVTAILTDPIDDLYTALGKFALYTTIEAEVQRDTTQLAKLRYRLSIDRVGIYVQDNYDFRDEPGSPSQILGFWNFETGDVRKFPAGLHYHLITNATFQEWRKRHGRGGDFWVYSDIKTLCLSPRQTVVVEP